MAQLELTKGKVALVDKEDLQRCNKHLWYYNPVNGYAHTFIDGKIVYLHNFILNIDRGADHRNRNKLDCQKDNLRQCEHFQNCANRTKSHGQSKYKGVHFNTSRQCWYAKIRINYRSIHIGRYDSDIEAAQAYDKKAKELLGEFALTNF